MTGNRRSLSVVTITWMAVTLMKTVTLIITVVVVPEPWAVWTPLGDMGVTVA